MYGIKSGVKNTAKVWDQIGCVKKYSKCMAPNRVSKIQQMYGTKSGLSKMQQMYETKLGGKNTAKVWDQIGCVKITANVWDQIGCVKITANVWDQIGCVKNTANVLDQNEEDLRFFTNERVCLSLLDFGTFNWCIDFDFDLSG